MTKRKNWILIAGAGAGLGQSLATRFQAGGYDIIGLGRSTPSDVTGRFVQIDLTDDVKVRSTLGPLVEKLGPPKVVIHNTAELVISPFKDTTLQDYQNCWASMVQSAVLLMQNTLQPMADAGGGAFLVSGATASLRGGARFSAFASAKFALRGLTQSLAREYQSAGVHLAHVILDGIIDTERSRGLHHLDPTKMMKPDDIAETYFQIAHQPRSTWSHEIDLRPASESF